MTAKEYYRLCKQMQRSEKRAAGLVLRTVWVRPEVWPMVKELARQMSEAHDD